MNVMIEPELTPEIVKIRAGYRIIPKSENGSLKILVLDEDDEVVYEGSSIEGVISIMDNNNLIEYE